MSKVIKREILNKLGNDSSQKRIVHLYGVYGVGKTTLLESLEKSTSSNFTFYVNLSNIEQDNIEQLKDNVLKIINDSGVDHKKNKIDKDTIIHSILESASISIGKSLSGSFSISKILKNLITKVYNNYNIAINNTSYEKMSIQLSRILTEVLEKCNKSVVLLLDNIQNIDQNAGCFISTLFRNHVISSVVATSENSDDNLFSILSNSLDNNILSDSSISIEEFEIKEFSLAETCNYLCELWGEKLTTNDKSVQDIQNVTAGLPLLVSIIVNGCSKEQIKALDFSSGNISNKLSVVFNVLYKTLSDDSKKILFIISLCGGAVDTLTIKNAFPKLDFAEAIEELVSKRLIIENENELILKHSILINEIKKANSKSIYRTKEIYKALVENYIYSNYKSLRSLYELHCSMSNHKDALAVLPKLCEELIGSCNHTLCIQYIESALTDSKFDPSEEQLEKILFCLLKSYFYTKQNQKCIKLFELYKGKFMSNNEAMLFVSQAAYYLNNFSYTIELCNKINAESCSNLFHQKQILLSSAYDLCGEYQKSSETHINGRIFAENHNDEYATSLYNMSIQMVSTSYNECITKLKKGLSVFESYGENRNLACINNNIGIEMLMAGNENCKQYLEKSLQLFNNSAEIEIQFPLNNLGLYYILMEKNYQKAGDYFKKALKSAISPLQFCYIYNNLAILKYLSGNNNSDTYFSEAQKYAEDCPDPIVKAKVNYNLYKYAKTNNYNNCYSFLDKGKLKKVHPQYVEISRRYAVELTQKYTNDSGARVCDRRIMFDKQEWFWGELMFYN